MSKDKGYEVGHVNLSEAIEVAPLTEAFTEAYNRNSYKPPQRVTPVVDEDAERAAFEKWILEYFEGGNVDVLDKSVVPGEYSLDDVQLAFEAVLWRASRG